MDEKELQAVSEALDQLRKGSTVSAETLAKLGGTTQNVNKALEGYTKRLLGATSAVGSMAKQVADGEGSFKSLGGTITGLTGVIGKLASAIPLVGGAAKALAEGVGEAAKFVLDQLDVMAKNYQTLGDASAGAADGVDGLLRQFNQLGNYSLPAFTKAVRANTTGLAALGGTAALGAEELSKVAGSLTTGDTARKFLRLGISLDAVGDATAQYLADSARYGITQGMTTDELTKKTQNYIVEVDKIARLTGQTREQQAKEAQKSLVDARFRAKLAEMTANGQKNEAEQLRLYVEGLGGAAGDAARALVTGIPLTKEAAAANLFANDAIRQNTEAVQQGMKATEAITSTQEALARGTDTFGKQIQYAGDMFGGVAVQAYDTKAMLALQNQLMAEGLTREQAVAEAQRRQAEASGKTTTEFTDAQLATAGASKNIQSLGFSLATYAIPAVDKFAGALEKITGYINQKFGVGGTVSTPRGVNRGRPGGPRASAGGAPQTLLDLIGQGESGGDYNALVGGGRADLTGMTIAQVQEFQKNMRAAGRPSTAVGKYQMIASTLAEQAKKAGLDPTTTKFDEKTQDLLAQQLISQAGYGRKDPATVMRNLAGTWAALPQDMSGRGRYDGYNTNKANVDPNQLMAAIAGPSGRYNSPVKDVPAPTAGADTKIQGDRTTEQQQQASQTGQLTRQLAELNQTQRDLLAVNKKILQRQG
jgi:hypothetical protein